MPRDELDNTERVCRTRKVRVLKAALLKARAEMWDDAAGKPKPGQGNKVAEWQKKYKCKLDPIPWWCGDELPDQHEFFGMLPNCELHSLTIGLFGEHMIDAAMHK